MQDDALAMVDEAEELTDALRTQVLFAREYLKSVTIGPKQVSFPSMLALTIKPEDRIVLRTSSVFDNVKSAIIACASSNKECVYCECDYDMQSFCYFC